MEQNHPIKEKAPLTPSGKMLFSSFGFRSPLLREKFASVIPTNDSLKEKLCLILPYAGFHVEKTFEREKKGLVEFGFHPDRVRFVRAREDLTREIPHYLYVPGGNPFQLLKTIKEMGIREEIARLVQWEGTVYIGVSAGADLATKDLFYVKQLEDNNEIHDEDYKALGLIPEAILCHFDHHSVSTLMACQTISGTTVIPIRDDQLVLYENGIWEYREKEK